MSLPALSLQGKVNPRTRSILMFSNSNQISRFASLQVQRGDLDLNFVVLLFKRMEIIVYFHNRYPPDHSQRGCTSIAIVDLKSSEAIQAAEELTEYATCQYIENLSPVSF